MPGMRKRQEVKSQDTQDKEERHEVKMPGSERSQESYRLLTPGLDNTCLFMSLTAGAGTRCMSLLSSSPNLFTSDIPFPWFLKEVRFLIKFQENKKFKNPGFYKENIERKMKWIGIRTQNSLLFITSPSFFGLNSFLLDLINIFLKLEIKNKEENHQWDSAWEQRLRINNQKVMEPIKRKRK